MCVAGSDFLVSRHSDGHEGVDPADPRRHGFGADRINGGSGGGSCQSAQQEAVATQVERRQIRQRGCHHRGRRICLSLNDLPSLANGAGPLAAGMWFQSEQRPQPIRRKPLNVSINFSSRPARGTKTNNQIIEDLQRPSGGQKFKAQ